MIKLGFTISSYDWQCDVLPLHLGCCHRRVCMDRDQQQADCEKLFLVPATNNQLSREEIVKVTLVLSQKDKNITFKTDERKQKTYNLRFS